MIERPRGEPDTERELRDLPDGNKALVIRRAFRASVERVWSALTDPDEIIRWYLPLEGDLREGGYYMLVGNAIGEIRRCDRPREIAVSWIYGEFESELGLRLTARGSESLLELVHGPLPLNMIPNPTPDLWGLAVNWEMVLLGLDDFLAGTTPEGKAIDWLPRQSDADRAQSLAHASALNEAWVALIDSQY